MAQTIQLKRSSVAGNIPGTSDLALGEIAINTADGAVYIKTGNDDIVAVADDGILHIDTTNSRVGIATTTPDKKLDVVGDGSFSGVDNLLYLQAAATGTPTLRFEQGTTRRAFIRYQNANSNFDIINEYGGVTIWTGTSGSESQKLIVDSSGNVGIGGATPNQRLVIADTTGETTLAINNATTTTGNHARLDFRHNGITGSQIKSENIEDFTTTANRTSDLQFYTRNNGTIAEAMRITEAGNIGVGLTSPQTNLHLHSSSNTQITFTDSATGTGSADGFRVGWNGIYGQMYLFENADMRFATNNAVRMTIKNDGNVGIGTTSPSAKLHVDGDVYVDTGHAVYADFFRPYAGTLATYGSSTSTEHYFLGKVGIGTSSPARDLQIKKANSGGQVRAEIFNTSDTANSHGVVSIYSGGTSAGNPFLHWKVDGSTEFSMGIDNSDSDKLKISKNFGPGASEYLAIDTSGNVGIGTTSPAQLLDVDGVARFGTSTYRITLDGNSGGGYFKIGTTSNDDSLANFGAFSSSFVFDTTQTNGFVFKHNGSEKMRITSAGNVGIGTISPDEMLHVYGNLRVGTTSGGRIKFSDSDDTEILGRDQTYGSGASMTFKVNDADRMHINNSGAITFNSAYTFPTSDGSANQVLQTDGSGNLSFATVSGGGGVTVSNNANNRVLTGDGTNANAEANLTFDGSTLSVTGDMTMAGSSPTLSIPAHSGIEIDITGSASSGNIRANTDLYLLSQTAGLHLGAGGTNGVLSINSSGNTSFTGDVSIADSQRLKIGNATNGDLSFIHDGTKTYIQNITGDLDISNTQDDGDIFLKTDDGSGGITTYLKADGSNGTLQLMHYGSLKLSTTSSGISVTGNITTTGRATIGDSSADELVFTGLLKQGLSGGTTVIDASRNLTNIAKADFTAKQYNEVKRPDYDASATNTRIANVSTDKYIANVPFGDAWHDIFAHRRHYTWTYETSTDGTNFTSATINDNIFDHRDESKYEALGSSIKAVRWTVTDVQHANLQYISLSQQYTASTPQTTLTVENGDGSTYSTVMAETTFQGSQKTHFFALDTSVNNTHIRITLKKATISDTNAVEISRLCAWTARSGNQGRGKEGHLPFDYSLRDQITLKDSQELRFGNSSDLVIEHNATNSTITNNTGDLIIQNAANDKDIYFKSDDGSGGITTYFYIDGSDSSTRFTVNPLKFNDNIELLIGNSSDLRILHNATDTHILNNTGDFYISNSADDKDIIFRSDDGSGGMAEYFRLDGSLTKTYFEKNVQFNDSVKLQLGGGADLSLYHNGTDSYIVNNTGTLVIDAAGDILADVDGGDVVIRDGGAEFARIVNSSTNFGLQAAQQDKDIVFLGNDGGSTITALTLDMSDSGRAIFNHSISSGKITADTGDASAQPLTIGSSSSTQYTAQNWITSAHSGVSAYMIAYGASHSTQANHFAMKNLASGGEIFFELFGVEPLRLTSTGVSGAIIKDEDNMSSNSATHLATQQSIKAYVDAEVAGVVDSAPAALNTLNELAAALGDDANFSTTTSTALGNRLRVDTASQGLTGTQQANAITNLGITATKAELNYVDGVTSNIQTQLDSKVNTTINSNADNRIITGSGTANTLNAESGLTYDGSGTLAVQSSSVEIQLNGANSTANSSQIKFADNQSITPNYAGMGIRYNSDANTMTFRRFYNGSAAVDEEILTLTRDSKLATFAGDVTLSSGNSLSISGQTTFKGVEISGTAPGLYLDDTDTNTAWHLGANGDYIYLLEDTDSSGTYNDINARWNNAGYEQYSGNVRIRTGALTMGATETTVIDSSRNLTNIGTISSGAITSSGQISGTKGVFTQTTGSFPLTTSTAYDFTAKFESTDAGGYIVLEDNTSTNNGNYIGVNGDEFRIYTGGTRALRIASNNTITTDSNLTVTGNVTHNGLTMTSGTDIDQLTTTTVTATLSTSWQDTGINATDLASGTYIISVFVDDHSVGGNHYDELYSGVMSWHSGSTNSTKTDEILLHRAGHAPNNGDFFLRTERHPSGGDSLMLQMRGSTSNSGNSDYIFKFRRMI